LGCELITDAGLAHLHGLTGLQDLHLMFCKGITGAGIAGLKTALPRCEV
jgi:hypothetical protein